MVDSNVGPVMNPSIVKSEFSEPPPRNDRTNRAVVSREFRSLGIKDEDLWEIGVDSHLERRSIWERLFKQSRQEMIIDLFGTVLIWLQNRDNKKKGLKAKDFGEGIYYAVVSPDKAFEYWKKLFARTTYTGLYPFLFGSFRLDSLGLDEPYLTMCPTKTLEAGLAIDIDAWVEDTWRDESVSISYELGVWPDKPLIQKELFPVSLFSNDKAAIAIVLVPGSNSWEAVSNISLGGNNPTTEYYVGMLKRWHERYGAELVSLDSSNLDLVVSRRPETREEAISVTREMIVFCCDIVGNDERHLESISELAAHVMHNDIWYFWWD